jgi:hypothetical protein
VNAKDPDGRTALLLAAASDVVPLGVITALIDRGADVNTAAANGQTALTLAAQRGNRPVIDLLVKHGAKPQPAAVAPAFTPAPAASPRAAVERALPVLQRSDVTFLQRAGCVSCHNNTLTAMAVARARSRGVPVDEQAAQGQKEAIGRFVASWRDRLLQGIGIPGEHDTVSSILLGMSAERHGPDETTDAMVRFLRRTQSAAGHWPIDGYRPPIESSDIQVTPAAMRSMQLYAPASEGAAYDAAVRRAAAWLAKADPLSTEDRAFQLLGLGWAKAPSGSHPEGRARAHRGAAARRRMVTHYSEVETELERVLERQLKCPRGLPVEHLQVRGGIDIVRPRVPLLVSTRVEKIESVERRLEFLRSAQLDDPPDVQLQVTVGVVDGLTVASCRTRNPDRRRQGIRLGRSVGERERRRPICGIDGCDLALGRAEIPAGLDDVADGDVETPRRGVLAGHSQRIGSIRRA